MGYRISYYAPTRLVLLFFFVPVYCARYATYVTHYPPCWEHRCSRLDLEAKTSVLFLASGQTGLIIVWDRRAARPVHVKSSAELFVWLPGIDVWTSCGTTRPLVVRSMTSEASGSWSN